MMHGALSSGVGESARRFFREAVAALSREAVEGVRPAREDVEEDSSSSRYLLE